MVSPGMSPVRRLFWTMMDLVGRVTPSGLIATATLSLEAQAQFYIVLFSVRTSPPSATTTSKRHVVRAAASHLVARAFWSAVDRPSAFEPYANGGAPSAVSRARR